MEAGTEKRYQEFISASKEIDEVYHMLALKFGLSDSAMWILCTMREANRELTQSEIAQEMSMSRQTVNSAIKTWKNRDIFSWKQFPVTEETRLFPLQKKEKRLPKRLWTGC